jgi:hypothetical protein
VPTNVTVEWGSRSRALFSLLPQKARTGGPISFWLNPGQSPVKLGIVAPGAVAEWDTAPVVEIATTWDAARQSVTGLVPDGPLHVRMDFDLQATIGGVTSSVLAFRQLFLVPATPPGADVGALASMLPAQYWFAATVIEPDRTRPRFVPLGWPGSRRRLGLHPLLTAVAGRVSVNAEFVDVTDLWWGVRKDRWGWYLNKEDLGGRQEHLRVLAWTGGGDPMIWFAVVPEAASGSDLEPASSDGKEPARAPADIVFYRPVPEVNSIPYAATPKGFLDPKHDDTTMYILARYLLAPIRADRLDAIRKSGRVLRPALLNDQILPVSQNPTHPADPMNIDKASGQGFRAKFRPVGMEEAVNGANFSGVLLLPLGAGDHDHPYDGAQRKDLKSTVRSALALLWNNFAFGILAGSQPRFDGRELWLGAHSAGNFSLWASLKNNAADVARIISHDASPKEASADGKIPSNLFAGLPSVTAAAKVRSGAGLTLDAFFITTPNTTQRADTGLTDEIDLKLRRTLARITVLPPFERRSSYWALPPTNTSNEYLRYLLTHWDDALLAASAKTPAKWFFLFFHELAMFGGDLAAAPSPPVAVGPAPAPAASGQPPPAPVVKTFFQMALGAPNPRPAPP